MANGDILPDADDGMWIMDEHEKEDEGHDPHPDDTLETDLDYLED